MKNIILIFSLIGFGQAAHAKDYSLKDICEKKSEKKIEFAEKLRNRITSETAKLKEETEDANKFDHSDMHMWLLLTYPDALPKFLFSAEARECAEKQMNFLQEIDKDVAAEKLNEWRTCLNEGYKEAMPDMAKRLMTCFEPKSEPKKK